MKTMEQHVDPAVIFAGLTLLGMMLTGYAKLMAKIKELEIRLNSVEKQDDKIIDKLDTIVEKISEIQIELQNKQDK